MMPLTTLAVPQGRTEEDGPVRWREINKVYATCQADVSQSLMDIQATTTSKLGLPAPSTQYVDGPARFRNINHMLQAAMSSYASNSTEIDETFHYLEQFDFHAPSEYTLNGKTYPSGMQSFHKNQSGDITIVAIMFDVGEQNQAIQNLRESLPTMEDSSMDIFSPINIRQFLPDDKTYRCHRGSPTTPLCIEDVTWSALKAPVALSAEQLDKLHYVVGPANNRPLQPLNERKTTDSYFGDIEILH